MSKPIDPKDTNLLVPVDPAQVPTIKRPLNKWRKFRRLSELGDELIERCNTINDLARQIRKREPGQPLPDCGGLNDYDRQRIAEFGQLLELLNPEDNYEEEDEDDCVYLKRKVIRNRLALLIGSKHIGQPTTPEAYTTMLLEHVAGLDPFSYLALESACRGLETENKFLPDISEVVAAIQQHDELWYCRKHAFWIIERAAADLASLITKEQPRLEAELAFEKAQQARLKFTRSIAVLGAIKQSAIRAQTCAAEANEKVLREMTNLSNYKQIVAELAELCAAAEAEAATADANCEKRE
jgi:hypothetical protein